MALADGWMSVKDAERPPNGKMVLMGPIDGEVVVGFWDGDRRMWFFDYGYANRPVHPKYWKYYPKLPRERKSEINRQ